MSYRPDLGPNQPCEQFCSQPIGPDGDPGTDESRACCPECDRKLAWLCHDVLPSIRKHGYYAPSDAGPDEEFAAVVTQANWRQTMDELLEAIGIPDPIDGEPR